MEIAEALRCKCDKNNIYEFVNATNERGWNALHTASEKGNACICRLLVGHSALMTAQDRKGMTAQHHALEGGIDEVIYVLVKIPQVGKSIDLKDNRGYYYQWALK